MKSNLTIIFLLAVLSGCNSSDSKNVNNVNLTAEEDTCPPLRYGDKFEAVFIEKSSCGSLNNIELIYNYLGNDNCTETKNMVDMSKYRSTDTKKVCSNGLKIYAYEKIQ